MKCKHSIQIHAFRMDRHLIRELFYHIHIFTNMFSQPSELWPIAFIHCTVRCLVFVTSLFNRDTNKFSLSLISLPSVFISISVLPSIHMSTERKKHFDMTDTVNTALYSLKYRGFPRSHTSNT